MTRWEASWKTWPRTSQLRFFQFLTFSEWDHPIDLFLKFKYKFLYVFTLVLLFSLYYVVLVLSGRPCFERMNNFSHLLEPLACSWLLILLRLYFSQVPNIAIGKPSTRLSCAQYDIMIQDLCGHCHGKANPWCILWWNDTLRFRVSCCLKSQEYSIDQLYLRRTQLGSSLRALQPKAILYKRYHLAQKAIALVTSLGGLLSKHTHFSVSKHVIARHSTYFRFYQKNIYINRTEVPYSSMRALPRYARICPWCRQLLNRHSNGFMVQQVLQCLKFLVSASQLEIKNHRLMCDHLVLLMTSDNDSKVHMLSFYERRYF